MVLNALLAFATFFIAPVLSVRPWHVFWAWVWSIAQGLSPLWYFQGREQMIRAVVPEGAGRVIALVAMILFVRMPEHGALALALQAFGAVTGSGVGLYYLYKDLPARQLSLRASFRSLSFGFSMFLYRIASTFYTVLNVFLLGLSSGPLIVSCFAGAERLTSLAIASFWPFWRALYPRVVRNLANNAPEALRQVRLALLTTTLVGIAIALAFELAAPYLMPLFLGTGYDQSISVLRLLAPVVPLAGITGACGILLMVPLGRDRAFSYITAIAGIVNVLVALTLVPARPLLRMPVLVVTVEAFITLAIIWSLRRIKADILALHLKSAVRLPTDLDME